ncbi:transposase family protein [Streptomyces sp. NPDC049099]|uniref:transposase family protein n=1 Tax=Streptomyces sp. NPDC049099 TaxID=3155768 RepID=UPI00343099CC
MTVLVMQADASFWDSLVFGGIDDVAVEAVTAAFGTVDVVARGRASEAACPDCGRFSGRVHDSYQRRLKHLPLGGQSAVIRLTVRRFICAARDCPRRTFVEPFARLTTPYARFTTRLNHVVERVGLALAGRAGARLAGQLGISAGRRLCCAGSWYCRIRSSARRACWAWTTSPSAGVRPTPPS